MNIRSILDEFAETSAIESDVLAWMESQPYPETETWVAIDGISHKQVRYAESLRQQFFFRNAGATGWGTLIAMCNAVNDAAWWINTEHAAKYCRLTNQAALRILRLASLAAG